MNENELAVEEVRRALGEKTNARGYRSFTKECRAVAVKFALERIDAGVSAGELADELGLKGWTLQRWLQRHRREGAEAREDFHQVEVKMAVPAKKVVVRG